MPAKVTEFFLSRSGINGWECPGMAIVGNLFLVSYLFKTKL